MSAQASAAPPATAKTVAEAQPAQKILTVADVLGSNSEWKIQGPWATRLSGSGSGLSVRVLRLAAIGHAQVNGALQQASLFVTCQGNKTELYVNFGLPLDVDSNKVDMEYQIDDGAVAKETWNASVDQKGAFAPKPIVLLRAMLNANKIIFRTGYQNREVMGTIFFLDDLAEALKPVQSACNWK
ncbi:MAG: type VI secretion protein [Deltaproteobacteria bacterium]|nr:type VI secretion protein [Deltaproteobacteria bacterium]